MTELPASGRQQAYSHAQTPGGKVISLKAYSRGQVSENDLRNIAQPLGQIHAARILMRKWSVLPDQEFKVISVIFGAMTAWGKETRKFTYRFLESVTLSTRGQGTGSATSCVSSPRSKSAG